uniref:Uncharacterized protein n=1 Tax=viral metagenome TaxID=1070528 RepID=A0A6C0HT04_9ZZZZ
MPENQDTKKDENGKKTEKKVLKESPEGLKVIQRLLPISYLNSKNNRIGEIQTFIKGELPTDNVSGVNYLLYNTFKYANDKDKDTKDINDFFPHYDTDKEFKVINYKSEEEQKIEEKERKESYEEMKKLFDNLKIVKDEINDIVDSKNDTEFIEIKEEIEKRFRAIDESDKNDFEKEKMKRREIFLYSKLIFGKIENLNEELNKVGNFTDKSKITKKKGGKKHKKKTKTKKIRKNKQPKKQKKTKKTKF